MWICRVQPLASRILAGCVLAAAGCGYSGGEALFMTGLFKRPTVEAEFKLTDQPVLIVVDDFQEHAYWPETTTVLAEEIAKELKRAEAAQQIVPAARIKRVRQAHPDFDERSTREIGELLGADQVIAVEIRAFHASVDPTQASAAARISVAVKVINVLEKKSRSKVRLWPPSPEGRVVYAELSAARVTEEKTRKAIIKALTAALAEKVVKNFYDRKVEDFETP